MRLPCIENEVEKAAPLIGLFKGSSDLAIRSEEILQEEIKSESGWSWKNIRP